MHKEKDLVCDHIGGCDFDCQAKLANSDEVRHCFKLNKINLIYPPLNH